jgi:hypothetical protein
LNFGETYGKGVHSSRGLGLRRNLCTGGKAWSKPYTLSFCNTS